MKIKIYSRHLAAATLAFAVFSSLAPVDVSAHQRSGPGDGTVDRHITRTPGEVEKITTYTRPTGEVSTREAIRITDPVTGNVSASSTTTLANGKTASSRLTSEKTDTGRTTTGEHTGFTGKISSYDSTTTKTDNGFTRDTTKTGPNGGGVEKDVTVARNNGTVTHTATTTIIPPPKS